MGSHLQWIRLRGQRINRGGRSEKAAALVGTAKNITEQQLRVKKLDQLAQYDPLTGLLNRKSLQIELQKFVGIHSKVAVMFINLDGFKLINDTLGHEAGDEFLISVAQTLRRVLPKNALIGRYGGDEFVIALHYESDSTWRGYAKKLIYVKTPYSPLMELKLKVSGSIGVSLYPKHALSNEMLLEFADTAMYEAKATGRDRYKIYDTSLTDVQTHRTSMLTALRRAVAEKSLQFEVQPVYSKELEVIGGELLCRWQSSEFGNVSPSQFIPLAEQYGLAGDITLLALQSAADIIESMPVGCDIWLSINICPEQILDTDFINELVALRDMKKIPQKRIKLEVTESVFLRDELDPESCLKRAKSHGFGLAMDDFGTGYSSLAYISRYPFDAVKIDKLFVTQMFLNDKSKKLVDGIAGLCRSLDIDIVAEGCETKKQVEYLQLLGVSALQGFGLSRPIHSEDFLNCIRNEKPGD